MFNIIFQKKKTSTVVISLLNSELIFLQYNVYLNIKKIYRNKKKMPKTSLSIYQNLTVPDRLVTHRVHMFYLPSPTCHIFYGCIRSSLFVSKDLYTIVYRHIQHLHFTRMCTLACKDFTVYKSTLNQGYLCISS